MWAQIIYTAFLNIEGVVSMATGLNICWPETPTISNLLLKKNCTFKLNYTHYELKM